jgi:pyruvate/oxaloacetate carboxyltransferase
MVRHIGICDETLRDAHQCLLSMRMTNEMILPIAARMDRIGFDAIDLIGGAVWDVSVRFLKEDPWERIRLARKLVRGQDAEPLLFRRAVVAGARLHRLDDQADNGGSQQNQQHDAA